MGPFLLLYIPKCICNVHQCNDCSALTTLARLVMMHEGKAAYRPEESQGLNEHTSMEGVSYSSG